MEIVLYGLKNCDRCRKALRALEAAGHDARLVDVRDAPLSAAQIARFEARFGGGLINRRSTTWRGLSEAERQRPAQELLAAHPALMKRPLIEAGEELLLGWDERIAAKLGAAGAG